MAKAVIMGGGGGGVSSDELTAARGDVLKGKTAVTSDSSDEPVEGTLELTGDAADSHVLSGKTYYNKDPKTRRTGTMPNRGAVAQELAAGGSYTVPEGYHNGAGKVTAKSLASQTGGATAADGDVLSGKTYWKDGAKRTGTMTNQGAKTAALNAGGSYTIPAGYHNGSGKVTANSLASQTSANAAAGHILSGKTAWVNGVKVTGTLAVQSAISFSAAALSHDKIRISWKNPAKGPWQGVFIQMSTSGNPGTGGGTRVYTGAGNNPNQAGGSNYVDITGLSPSTSYYFTCTSYCDALGWGASSNIVCATQDRTIRQIISDLTASPQFSYMDYAGGKYYMYQVGITPIDDNSYQISSSKYKNENADNSALVDGKWRYGIGIIYGRDVEEKLLSAADIATLKKYKFKILNRNGGLIMDFGQIIEVKKTAWYIPGGGGYYYAHLLLTNSGDYDIRTSLLSGKLVFYK